MKMKNIDIIQMLNALNGLSSVELPVRLAFGIKKNHKKLLSEYQDYEEQLKVLQEKHDEKSAEYGKELRELLDIENDIEFHKVPESVFDGDFNITLQQLSALDFMIETE